MLEKLMAHHTQGRALSTLSEIANCKRLPMDMRHEAMVAWHQNATPADRAAAADG